MESIPGKRKTQETLQGGREVIVCSNQSDMECLLFRKFFFFVLKSDEIFSFTYAKIDIIRKFNIRFF